MEYMKLGPTGMMVSRVGFGGIPILRESTPDAVKVLRRAFEMGVNYVDTHRGYGDSEIKIGKALGEVRERYYLSTKIADHSRKGAEKSLRESLKRLQTDYIDLYQIHFIDRNVPIEETLAAFEELKQEGKIRAAGTCNSGITDVKDLCGHGHVATNQMPYSLLWRAIELGIRKACMEHAVDLLCYSPLALGLLTGKFRSADEVPAGRARTRHFSRNRAHTRHDEPGFEEQTFEAINQVRDICKEAGISMAVASLAWVLAQEGVASVIVGARNPTQIAENVSAIEADVPTEVLQRLSAATRELRDLLGPNPDPWQSDSRAR